MPDLTLSSSSTTTTTTMSPASSSSSSSSNPAALAALLATALADVERLKHDLDATTRRATAAENILRTLAPDAEPDHHHPTDPPQLSPSALATLVQAESRAGAAEARLQTVLDAWADLLRHEERAADERKRIDDEARAARRALGAHYPTSTMALRAAGNYPRAQQGSPTRARAQPHPYPAGPSLQLSNGTGPNGNNGSNNNNTANNNPRIRPRTSSDAHLHAPSKRARGNSWNDRQPSRSPDTLAGPGQGVQHDTTLPLTPHPHPTQPHAYPTHPEPSVEDLILETVERPRRARPEPSSLQPEPTLLNVPTSTPSAGPAVPPKSTIAKTASTGGPRTCRQCGQAGRYKDGKCVEKWGPGPEGPGTVCDRCRKKMKRVERRGDSSAALAIAHPPTATPSAPTAVPPPAPAPAPPPTVVLAPAPPPAPTHTLSASSSLTVQHSPPPTFSPLHPPPRSSGSHTTSASHSSSPQLSPSAAEVSDDIASSKDGEGEGDGEGDVDADADGDTSPTRVSVKREGSEV